MARVTRQLTVEGGRAYTMYRLRAGMLQFGRQDQEVVAALNTADGKTVWEHRYDAPVLPGMQLEYGPGPHTAPLVAGPRLFTAGAMGHFFALDNKHGESVVEP